MSLLQSSKQKPSNKEKKKHKTKSKRIQCYRQKSKLSFLFNNGRRLFFTHCDDTFLRVEAVRIRGQVASEAAVSSPDQNETKDPVGKLVANLPQAKNEELRGVRLGDVHRLQAVELERNDTTLANRLGDAGVHAALRNGGRAVANGAKHS